MFSSPNIHFLKGFFYIFKKQTQQQPELSEALTPVKKACGILYLTKSIPSGQETKSYLSQSSHLEVLLEHQMFRHVSLFAASRSECVETSASAASEDSLSLSWSLEAFDLWRD